ncbi:hypothetical protein GUITHDRAFT_135105 [Guillardia theta CCMP2712]|uniref:Uncharacterized protein n=1 Tax=Guillardia theta (strain CCMP2712) TaxID=905079 RepID=L1JPP5_GUITC|nr:hypothetical protein GUITHDRAFT_135105 [Guillardia theta CCMP2712]EKX50417.1 hypothetical protein GUITHDRAFT_135105 [Guillardia theta CCMP2712]|eukprot:XP_005837397.1 hypothetical protein GUITHDRAFT_135105 [Guillardia theta CCMP2712]
MDIEDFHVRNQKKEKLEQRKEAAEITQRLLQASQQNQLQPKVGGQFINAFGQEEVGISRREARASALRQLYASSTEKVGSVQITKRPREAVQKYVPRSFNESKYEMGQCWGLSTSKPKHVKPVSRSRDPLKPREAVPCLPPDEPRSSFLDRLPPPPKPVVSKDKKKKK